MKRMNLIPSEGVKKSKVSSLFYLKLSVFLIIIFFLLVFWQATAIFRYQFKIASQEQEFKTLKLKLSQEKLAYETLKRERQLINEKRKKLAQRLSALQDALDKGAVWSKVLLTIGELVPEGLQLNKVVLNEDKLNLKGISLENSTVSKFMSNLDTSKYFKGTNFVYIQKKEKDTSALVEFEIVTRLAK